MESRKTFVGKRSTVIPTKKQKAKSRKKQKQQLHKDMAAYDGGHFFGKYWELLIFSKKHDMILV